LVTITELDVAAAVETGEVLAASGAAESVAGAVAVAVAAGGATEAFDEPPAPVAVGVEFDVTGADVAGDAGVAEGAVEAEVVLGVVVTPTPALADSEELDESAEPPLAPHPFKIVRNTSPIVDPSDARIGDMNIHFEN
jgi:hypothetical protein